MQRLNCATKLDEHGTRHNGPHVENRSAEAQWKPSSERQFTTSAEYVKAAGFRAKVENNIDF